MAEKLLRDPAPVLTQRIVRPLQEFLRTESAGGIVLLASTVMALIWANAPFGSTYAEFWSRHVSLDLHIVSVDESLRLWVNDALMAVFFYVVGLEIKREVIEGDLAEPRKAALPVAGAIGGMAAPAAIYLALNARGPGEHGWGIPMATDIAFAVGVVALVGSRVPAGLKVFLLALAIVDDIGAIAVIAVFYSDSIDPRAIAVAIGLLVSVFIAGRLGIRHALVYLALGIGTWFAVFESGVHATIAGVALGLAMPAAPRGARLDIRAAIRRLATRDSRDAEKRDWPRMAGDADADPARGNQPLLDRAEQLLHPWTSYVVIPIFALANAGIAVDGGAISAAAHSRIAIGVALGLVLGKPVGILLCAWLATRTGVAALPADTGWRHLSAAAVVAGIGFTVSLFISALAFDAAERVDETKLAILGASALMGGLGYVALRLSTRSERDAAPG